MKYMLDTNICIGLIRQKSPQLLARLIQHAPGEVGVSAITVAELAYGAQKSSQITKNLAGLEQFLLPLEIADFDTLAAAVYGELRAQLEGAGTPIGGMDLLIGAHALRLKAILVTNNLREFRRIPNLSVEDWMAA